MAELDSIVGCLKVPDESGNYVPILAIKGDKGDQGEVSEETVRSIVAEEIANLTERVPSAPSTAGTYVLKATVTSSGTTYAWTAES